jgi:GNAT superfamily N-acetyltransferase
MTFSIRPGTPADLDTLVAIDDDAGQLYEQAGLHLELPADHPFVANERARWLRSLRSGDTFVAAEDGGAAVGMAVLELLDGAPYLEQLSVRLASMRHGLGRALLGHAVAWAKPRGDTLWLMTYGHLPWNRPFYERSGFVTVPPAHWGPEMAARAAQEWPFLPASDQRIVMRRPL